MQGPGVEGWTYARSGVDRTRVGAALAALLGQVRYRPPPSNGRPIEAPGHYAGLVRIGRETLAITTDTVGTKTVLAARLHRWEGVGEDIVAVNVNDLAAIGARPAALVDCLQCDQPDPEVFRQLGVGLERGLRLAGCSLLGGETAVVPEIVRGVEVGGTAIGFFPRPRAPLLGRAIRPGDRLVGIPSEGMHANGFTLVRRVLDEHSVDLAHPRPGGGGPLGEELLHPTRIYVRVAEAMAPLASTHGMAHISGGGVRNLVRLHPKVAFVLDGWPAPDGIFRWIGDLGHVSDEELYQTFNMGIGFVVVVRPTGLSETLRRLARAGAPDARVLGHVERGEGVKLPHLGLTYRGYA
ncbi:MAG: phosphoribosylformylglycinamidine cyclo-ligase [Thermoplasmata archaeon]